VVRGLPVQKPLYVNADVTFSATRLLCARSHYAVHVTTMFTMFVFRSADGVFSQRKHDSSV